MKQVYILLRRIHDPYGCLEDNEDEIVGVFDNLELAEKSKNARIYLEKEYEKHRLLADEYERSADERFLSELMESQRIKNEIKKLYGNQNK